MRPAGFFALLFVLTGICAAQDSNFSVGPQYLMNYGSPQFLRPIATPSLSLEAQLPGLPSLPQIGPAVEDQSFVANPELQHQADLFPIYYGYPMATVVEIPLEEPSRSLPAGVVEVGVSRMSAAQSLREFGYGAALSEAAERWKARQTRARRVYTNADIEHLHRD